MGLKCIKATKPLRGDRQFTFYWLSPQKYLSPRHVQHPLKYSAHKKLTVEKGTYNGALTHLLPRPQQKHPHSPKNFYTTPAPYNPGIFYRFSEYPLEKLPPIQNQNSDSTQHIFFKNVWSLCILVVVVVKGRGCCMPATLLSYC